MVDDAIILSDITNQHYTILVNGFQSGFVANICKSLKLPIVDMAIQQAYELLIRRQLVISELPFTNHMSRFNSS